MAGRVELGTVSVGPGESGRGWLGTVELADGSRPGIPLLVANGADDGPTLLVMAAVHGTEVCCTAAVHRLMKGLQSRRLRGRVLCVPVANPIAVAHGDYAAWPDGQNMSGLWTDASRTGSLTQRTAALIWPLMEMSECVMDIHANPLPAMGFTLVSKSASAETFRLARAFGLTVISQTAPSNYSRGLREILGEKGVPMFCPELPGNIYYADHLAEMGERGALNVMKALGMIDGKAEPQRDTLVLPGEYEFVTRLRVNRGGLLRPTAPPGTLLAKGSPAMEIINFLGEVVEEVLMPCEGYCWSFSTGSNVSYSAVVSEGQRVGYVFRRVGCA